jgi:KDO2-lipid IV(A) lauroyltransferase
MTADRETPEYSHFARLKFKPFQALRRELQYWVVWAFFVVATRLPVAASQRIGRWLGSLLFPLVRRDRAICEYQLELVFPELDAKARRELAVRSFRNLGMTLMETLAIPRIRREAERWVQLEGVESIRAAYEEGRGVILITGHMANWELLAVAFEQMKIPAQAVARSIVNPRLNELVTRHRQSDYLQVVQRGSRQSPRQLLTCLKQGQVLLVVIDHDTNVSGVFVDFFGRPANTPRVAAGLALRMGVPVVSAFGRRREDGSHLFHFQRIRVPKGLGDDTDGIRRLTQLFSDAMESHIRECPEQWTWNHRRWKRRPDSGPRPEEAAREGKGRRRPAPR